MPTHTQTHKHTTCLWAVHVELHWGQRRGLLLYQALLWCWMPVFINPLPCSSCTRLDAQHENVLLVNLPGQIRVKLLLLPFIDLHAQYHPRDTYTPLAFWLPPRWLGVRWPRFFLTMATFPGIQKSFFRRLCASPEFLIAGELTYDPTRKKKSPPLEYYFLLTPGEVR